MLGGDSLALSTAWLALGDPSASSAPSASGGGDDGALAVNFADATDLRVGASASAWSDSAGGRLVEHLEQRLPAPQQRRQPVRATAVKAAGRHLYMHMHMHMRAHAH